VLEVLWGYLTEERAKNALGNKGKKEELLNKGG